MKDQTFRELTIRIDKVRAVKGNRYNCEYIDKMYMVNIKQQAGGIGFAVKATGNYGRDLRKVFRRIKEVLHI